MFTLACQGRRKLGVWGTLGKGSQDRPGGRMSIPPPLVFERNKSKTFIFKRACPPPPVFLDLPTVLLDNNMRAELRDFLFLCEACHFQESQTQLEKSILMVIRFDPSDLLL